MSPTTVQEREPFGAPNFACVLNRVLKYVACVQTCGSRWMGLQFQVHVLQLPNDEYTLAYDIPMDCWKEVVLSDGFKVLGTKMATEYDLAQLHLTYNLQNPDLQKQRIT